LKLRGGGRFLLNLARERFFGNLVSGVVV
jgi:hypothetical protein